MTHQTLILPIATIKNSEIFRAFCDSEFGPGLSNRDVYLNGYGTGEGGDELSALMDGVTEEALGSDDPISVLKAYKRELKRSYRQLGSAIVAATHHQSFGREIALLANRKPRVRVPALSV